MGKETIFIYVYGYLPGQKYGGPVTALYNFAEHFGDVYDIRIVCSNHDHGERKRYEGISNGWNSVGKASVCYLPEREYSRRHFRKLMETYEVKWVYLTGVFSYVLNHAAIGACRDLGVRVVIALRGEICRNILAMKRYKKIPYLFLMRSVKEFREVSFQVTSDEEYHQLKKYLNIPDGRIIRLPDIHGEIARDNKVEKTRGIARALFLSRIHPKKNLLDVIRAANRIQNRMDIDIFGPIEDEAYWAECKKEIEFVPDNVKIRYCGELDMQGAKDCYAGYHMFVFPTLSENYGHVIAEALLADCPVILSRGTTPWDDLDGRAGYTVGLHDIEALAGAMNRIIEMDESEYRKLQESLREYREEKLRVQELLEGYERMIRGGGA